MFEQGSFITNIEMNYITYNTKALLNAGHGEVPDYSTAWSRSDIVDYYNWSRMIGLMKPYCEAYGLSINSLSTYQNFINLDKTVYRANTMRSKNRKVGFKLGNEVDF